jgi:hypothetical protein
MFQKGHQLSKESLDKMCKTIKEGFLNGRQVWNKGRHHTSEAIEKNRLAHLGKPNPNRGKKLPQYADEKNPNWKGKLASISAFHKWVIKHKGKPEICVDCGITCKERKLHWSNIDHKYRRNLDDYMARCVSCHRKYDKIWIKRKRNAKGQFI